MSGYWRTNPNHPTLPGVEPGTKAEPIYVLPDSYGKNFPPVAYRFACTDPGGSYWHYVESVMRRYPGIFEYVEEEDREPKWPGPGGVYCEGGTYFPSHIVMVPCSTLDRLNRVRNALRAVLKALGEGKKIYAGDLSRPDGAIAVIVRPDGEVKS